MNILNRLKNKRNPEKIHKSNNPFDAPDLIEHRYDSNNIHLGSESISLRNGHAGTSIAYYAELGQVIVYQYAVGPFPLGSNYSVERITIPQNTTSKSEIISFLKREHPIYSHILPQTDRLDSIKNSPVIMPQTKHCNACGVYFPNDAKFCGMCGGEI